MLHNVAEFRAKKSQKEPESWYCKNCDFSTSKIGNWKRHIKTKKHDVACMLHIQCKQNEKKSQPTTKKEWNCDCGNKYKYHQSFYRHKKQCNTKTNEELHPINDTNLVINNNEFTQENIEDCNNVNKLLAVIKEQQKQMAVDAKERNEIMKSIKDIMPQIGNNNTTNITNNTNVNVFLNKHYSNAVSIQDFAARLTLTLSELGVLRDDEPKAIANVIKKGLVGLSMTERPMHAHKRRWYVKDRNNGWENDDGIKIITTVKEGISRSGLPLLTKTAPEWETNEKHAILYAQTTAALMREVDSKSTTKVLKSIQPECDITKIGYD